MGVAVADQTQGLIERLELICQQIVLHHNLRGSRTLATTGPVPNWSADMLSEEALAVAPVALDLIRSLASRNEGLEEALREAFVDWDAGKRAQARIRARQALSPEEGG